MLVINTFKFIFRVVMRAIEGTEAANVAVPSMGEITSVYCN